MTPAARLEQPLVVEALNREVSDRNVLWSRQTAAAGPAAPIPAQTGAEGEVTPFTDERSDTMSNGVHKVTTSTGHREIVHPTLPHAWVHDDQGNVDNFVLSTSRHNGPRCAVCDLTFCEHCHPHLYASPCPTKTP